MFSGCQLAYRNCSVYRHKEEAWLSIDIWELFELLEKEGYISEEELKCFKRLIFLRNLIAHEYYRISDNELLEMVNLLERVEEFVYRVRVEAGRL
jgi:uncharacterized protein YutE (UPF0331/DUF86 family)